MIADINKIYVLSAPKATEGMDMFIESTSSDMTFVKFNKIHSAEAEVRCISKMFGHTIQGKPMWMQAVIYITDLPVEMAKKKLEDKILFIQTQGKKGKN